MWLLTETCCGIFLLRLCTRSKSHLFSSVPFPSLPFLHFSPILTVYFFFFPILPYFLSWLSIYFFPSLLRLKSNSLWRYFSTGSTQNFLPTGCVEMHSGTIVCHLLCVACTAVLTQTEPLSTNEKINFNDVASTLRYLKQVRMN